jgi:hypothetical protein
LELSIFRLPRSAWLFQIDEHTIGVVFLLGGVLPDRSLVAAFHPAFRRGTALFYSRADSRRYPRGDSRLNISDYIE